MKSSLNNVIALLVVLVMIGCSKEPSEPSPVSIVEEPTALSSSASSEFSEDEPEEPELLVLPEVDPKYAKSLFTASIEGYAESTQIKRIYLNPSKCVIYSPDEIVMDGSEPFALKNGAKFLIVASDCLTADVKEVIVETSKGSFSTPVNVQ